MRRSITCAAIVLGLAAPSAASPERTQTVRLRVSDHVVRWHSPSRFRAMTRLLVRESVGFKPRGCIGYASGRGATVRFDGCGPGAQRMRIEAIALHPVRVLIQYRYH